MGEVPVLCTDDLHKSVANGLDLVYRGVEITIVLANKKYVIGGSDGEWANYIEVKIFDESVGKWENPKVFGTKPTPGTDYSVVIFDENYIFIIKNDSNIDDPIWFLEVGTKFLRRQSDVLGTNVVA